MSRRPPLPAAVVLAGVLLLPGCAADDPAASDTYTFDADHAAVRVDTPELRAAKAAAGIDDCPASDLLASARPRGLPSITLPCLGGGPGVNLAGLEGTPTVINFWAQYCGPCRSEAPVFQQVHEDAGDAVSVIGIDWQDPRPGPAIEFARELGLTYPQLADPEGATRAPMRVSALPITVFVDGSGRVTHVEYGAVESEAELAGLIVQHVGVEVPR